MAFMRRAKLIFGRPGQTPQRQSLPNVAVTWFASNFEHSRAARDLLRRICDHNRAIQSEYKQTGQQNSRDEPPTYRLHNNRINTTPSPKFFSPLTRFARTRTNQFEILLNKMSVFPSVCEKNFPRERQIGKLTKVL
jgi:hypothetical protein